MRDNLMFFMAILLWGGLTTSVQADSIPETISEVQPRVVKLFGAGGLQNLAGYGTGFLISPEGHIATVWSHLLDSDVVTVVLADGRRFYGKVLGTDSALDLAIVKIDADNLPFIDIKQTSQVGPGATILAFGNMFKVATGDEPVTVVHGVISAKTELSARRGRFSVPYSGPVYLSDAITNNSGAAGGLLTTTSGQPLGMLGRELKSDETNTWINYAIPLSELKQSMTQIMAGEFVSKDPLAANSTPEAVVHAIDFGIVLVPDVVYRTPAYVEAVIEESPAEAQGLLPDDLIVFANGELVHSLRTLKEVFRTLTPGGNLDLIVRRGGELITVTFPVPRKNNNE